MSREKTELHKMLNLNEEVSKRVDFLKIRTMNIKHSQT